MSHTIVAGLNGVDIAVIILILLLSVKGIINGFVNEIFNFIGLIGGIFIASRSAEPIADFIDKNLLHIQNISLLRLVGFLLVLGAVWVISSTIGKMVQGSGRNQTTLSRIFGFIVAGFKYLFVFSLILSALSRSSLIKENMSKTISTSKLYPVMDRIGFQLINISDIAKKAENRSKK